MNQRFTIHHWPALREWRVVPDDFGDLGICFHDAESGTLGLLEALSHCVRLAEGKLAAVVIESRNERFEFILRRQISDVARPDALQLA